jgi:hypothetical protein
MPLTAVSSEFAKPPHISEDFRLQILFLVMRPRLENLEAIIQSKDLLDGMLSLSNTPGMGGGGLCCCGGLRECQL